MVGQNRSRGYPCVLVDLNTQRDFCLQNGAHPVANTEELWPALRRVIAWARRNHVPLVSSIDSHRTTEVPLSGDPPYCMDGTIGQRKMDFTLFPSRTCVQVDNTLAVPLNLFAQYQQVVFRQRSVDLFDNPKADRFVTQMWTDEFVLFGNAVEGAVKAVALGLVARHKNVTVIRDACGYWDRASADLSFRLFAAKGVRLMTVDELLIRKLDRQIRYPKFAAGGSLGNNNGRPARRHNGQPLASPNTSQASRHLGGRADQTHRELPFPPDNGKIPRTFDP